KRRWLRIVLGCLVVTLLVAGPLAYSQYRQSQYRNFRIVEPGKFYRSGQMSLDAFQNTVREYQIKTVISLRYAENPGERPPDWARENVGHPRGTLLVLIPPCVWQESDDGVTPADKPVAEFLRVMDDPSIYPVLIHCFAGKHRTGAFCSLYRMEFQ